MFRGRVIKPYPFFFMRFIMANVRITGFLNEGGVTVNKTPSVSNDSLISNCDLLPTSNDSQDLGSDTLSWSNVHANIVNVRNQLIVSSSSSTELIRLQKTDNDSRYLVFENDGVDAFEMFINSFENFIFTTTNTTDDILFKLNGHTAIYMDGSPKEVRIWDTYNAVYNTQINSSLDINGTANSQSIIPKTDAVYNLGDPSTNVWNNVYGIRGNFGVLALQASSDPTVQSGFGHVYAKNVSETAEVFVQDGAGNITKISPHDSDGEWEYFSRNVKTGKVVRINMERMIRKLEEITGESFIQEWYEDVK